MIASQVGTCHSKKSLHGRPCSHNILQYRNGWNFVHLRFPHQLSLPSQLPFPWRKWLISGPFRYVRLSQQKSVSQNNFRFRLGMNSPLLDSFMVTNHPLHSVALDPIQIGSQKNIFNDISFFLRKAKRFGKRSPQKMVQCHNPFPYIP